MIVKPGTFLDTYYREGTLLVIVHDRLFRATRSGGVTPVRSDDSEAESVAADMAMKIVHRSAA